METDVRSRASASLRTLADGRDNRDRRRAPFGELQIRGRDEGRPSQVLALDVNFRLFDGALFDILSRIRPGGRRFLNKRQ